MNLSPLLMVSSSSDDENDPQFDEVGHLIANIKVGSFFEIGPAKVRSFVVVQAPPPPGTRAKEMDLIRLLLARIKEFKFKYKEIKKEVWII